MKNLILRTSSGVLYIALILCALLFDTHIPFISIFGIFLIIALQEFYHLVNPSGHKIIHILDIIGGASIFLSIVFIYYTQNVSLIWAVPYLTYFVIRQIIQLYITKNNPITESSNSYMGHIYVAIPFAALATLYFTYGAQVVLALFLLLWINDTGAFCVGCTLGKHKLFERISPKKSWEGFFGGLGFCIIAGVLFATVFKEYFGYSMIQWVTFGIATSVIGTWGDLSESLIKRTLKVKDSGKIIPGHGGILDRIDSLLLAVPAALIIFVIFNQFK